MSFTVIPEEPACQLADPGPPEACPHCGQRAFWRNGSYERHRLLLGPCRVQRWRCQHGGRTRSWQAILMRLYVLGVSLRATSASLELLGCFVSPATGWRDVQRWQAEAPWNTTAKLPGVVLLSPPVLALVEHVMDRWNDLVRCMRDPAIPSSTNRLGAGLDASGLGPAAPEA